MKQAVRQQMIKLRKSLDVHQKQAFDHHIIMQIRADERYQQADTVAIFYPMVHEIDLRDLMTDHKTFLFPKVIKDDIVFYPYQKEMRFTKSTFGVYEPKSASPFTAQIDYMLVPALAVDSKGHRIGYGKGFYDRYLAIHRPKTTIGVIYPFQLIDEIDYSDIDQPLDGYMKG